MTEEEKFNYYWFGPKTHEEPEEAIMEMNNRYNLDLNNDIGLAGMEDETE